MSDFATGKDRVEICPCGKSNHDGKFANFKDYTDKGYCHSCNKLFPIELDNNIKKEYEPWVNPYKDCKHLPVSDINFGPSALTHWFNRLGIGYNANLGVLGDLTIFWSRNIAGNYINGKVVKYDAETGKRDKNIYPRNLFTKDAGYGQCFFGLEDYRPQAKICIVESEKSAIIARHFDPSCVWLASGGASGITRAKSEVLRNCHVAIISDCDKAGREAAERGRKNLEYFNCNVETRDIDPNRNDGYDIGDYFIEKMIKGFV